MPTESRPPRAEPPHRRSPAWLPGFAVLVAVLVLVKGFSGAAGALWLQATTLATSFFGGPEAMAGVLWHTLPLAGSAAVITALVSAGKLHADSAGSLAAMAAIVLVGAAIGGLCRESREPTLHGPLVEPAETTAAQSPQETATRRLAAIEFLAPPDFAQVPNAVAPVRLLPEPDGVLGLICSAGNQLLGYAAAYNPRLFVASLLAGGYLGWTWQRRLALWHERLTTLRGTQRAANH